MEIIACPKCGSRRIFQGRMKDGVLTGYTSREVCRDCGYQGAPIIFDSEEDYIRFIEELKNKETKKEDITKKDPEKEKPVKHKRPYGLIILAFITVLYGAWILGMIISYPLLFLDSELAELIMGSIYFVAIAILFVLVIIGFIIRKGWAYQLAGTLFILGLPLGLFFLYYLTRPHVKAYFGRE
jgi:hypothetical protein